MKRVMILNGPNLNLLGVREPHIYGTTTLKQIKESCEQAAARLGMTLSFHQSNHEGELVDLIQQARQSADAIIINPAAYSFTSIAIIDAIKAFEGAVVEVHISNIHARCSVMPGLVPGIHVLAASAPRRTWMAGTSPAMTGSGWDAGVLSITSPREPPSPSPRQRAVPVHREFCLGQ